MVRGTRYLLVRNLPEKSTEESIINHFQRYGKIQSVKVHNGKENEGGATVAFMDIKSAAKAHSAENNVDGSVVQTEYCEGTAATGSVVTRTREPERGNYHSTTPRSSSSTFSNWPKGQEENNSRHESSETGELPPPTNFSTESEFSRSRPREKYGKFNQNRLSDGGERTHSRSKSGSRSPRSRSHSSSSTSSSSDSSATPSQSRSRASSPNSMRPPGLKKSSSVSTSKDKETKYVVEKAASEAGSTSTQPANPEKRPVGICVTKLPTRSSDTSLRDGLFHEYKKHGKVTSVQVISDDGERYAIVSFRKPEDAAKAMEASQDKMFFGTKIQVMPHEGIEVDDADFRPIETELDEYHPKSTRTLFVGNLEKDTSIQELVDKFKPYGEIIDVDIKRQGAASAYAFVQYADIVSVVKSLRAMEGEHIGANKIKLGFGKSMPTNCVWLDNIHVAENVSDNFLTRVFKRYGEVNYSVIDRVKGRSLVYFTNMDNAIYAVGEMRNRTLMGNKIQIDFASRECQNKFFDKMEATGQLRPGERPDERGRGGATTHRSQSRDYENFSDDSRGSYSQGQSFTNNRTQPFFRGSRSSSRGSRLRSTMGESSTYSEEYPSRRASRHSDEYSNSGDYYKTDDTYEQELREYDRSRRERRERGTSSPRRDERHLSISFDDRSHRSRDVSLDRYDDRSKDHYEHYRDSDSAGSDRNSYHSDNKYRSVDDKSYSHGKYVGDKGRCHDLDIIGDGDDGSRSQSPSSFHSPSRTPIPRRSSTPPTPTEAEPPMYRSSYYGDSDYKRKSRIEKPTEFVQHPIQGETITKSLHSVVCKPVTDVQKQEKSATRKRSYGDAMLSKDTLRSDYKIPRKIDSTVSSLVTKASNSQERSRIEKKLYHTDKKLEKAKHAKHEKLLIPESGFMLSSSPGSSGSRPDSENGSMGESDLSKLTQEKKALLQKLQQLDDGGSTSDNESTEDIRNVIARNQKSALTKTLFFKENLKRNEDKKIDSTKSYRKQMEKLRKLQNSSVKSTESSVKINFNGDESDTEEYADDSPKEISPEFRQTKRRKFDKEGESVTKSRPYRRKGSAFSSDEDMEGTSHKKTDSYAGRLHRIDTNSVLKSSTDTDEIQNRSKIHDPKHDASDPLVPSLLSPNSSKSAQSPDRETISAAFAKPSDFNRSHLHINIAQDSSVCKSGEIASPMSPPIGGEKHSLNSENQSVNTGNSAEDLGVPTDPRLDEKRLSSDSRYASRLTMNSLDDYDKDTPKADDSLSDSSIEEPKIPGELSISERIRLLDAQLDKAPDPPAVPAGGIQSTLNSTPTISSNITNYSSKFKIKKRCEASSNPGNSASSDSKNEPSDIVKQLMMSRRFRSILDQDSQRLEERKTGPPPGMMVRTKAAAKEISIPTKSGHWQGQIGGMRFQPSVTGNESVAQSQSEHLPLSMTSGMAAANSSAVQPGHMSLSPGSQFSASTSPFHPTQSPQLNAQQPASQFSLPANQASPGSAGLIATSQCITPVMEPTPYSFSPGIQHPISNAPAHTESQQPIISQVSLASEKQTSPVDASSIICSSSQSLHGVSQNSPPRLMKQNITSVSVSKGNQQPTNFLNSSQSSFGSLNFHQSIRSEAMKPSGLFSRRPSEAVASVQIPPSMQKDVSEVSLQQKRADVSSASIISASCSSATEKRELNKTSIFTLAKQETEPFTPSLFPTSDTQSVSVSTVVKAGGFSRLKSDEDRLGRTAKSSGSFDSFDKKNDVLHEKKSGAQTGFQQPIRPDVIKPSGLFSRRPSDAVASVQIPPGFQNDTSPTNLKRADSTSSAGSNSVFQNQIPSDKRENIAEMKVSASKKETDTTETTLGAPAQPPPAEPQSISSTTIIKSGSMHRSKSEDDRPQKSQKNATSHSSSFDLFEKKIEIFHEKKPDTKKHLDNKDHGKKDKEKEKSENKSDERSSHSKNISPDKKQKSKESDKKDSDKKHEKDKNRHHSGSKDKNSREKESMSSKDKSSSKSSKTKDDKKEKEREKDKEKEHTSTTEKQKSQDPKKKEKKTDEKKDEKRSDEKRSDEKRDDKKHEDKKHEDKDKDKDKKSEEKKSDKKDKAKHQDQKTAKPKVDSSNDKSANKPVESKTDSKSDKNSKDQKDQKKHSSHSKDKGGKEVKQKPKEDKNKDSTSKEREKEREKKKKEKEKAEKAKDKEKKKQEEEQEIPYEIPPELEPFISMYDKVKRRSCIKKKEENEEIVRSNFKRLKDKRKKKHNSLSDDSDFSMELSDSDSATSPGIMSEEEKPKKEIAKKKRQPVIDSLSTDDDDDMPFQIKRKKKTKTTMSKNRKIIDSSSESDKTMDYQTDGSEDEYVPTKQKKSPVKKRKSREESSEIDLHDTADNNLNRQMTSEMSVTEPETMDECEKKDSGKSDKEKKMKKKKDKEESTKDVKQKSKSVDSSEHLEITNKHEAVKTKAEVKKIEGLEEKSKKNETKKGTREHKKSSKSKSEEKEKEKVDDNKLDTKVERNETHVKKMKEDTDKKGSSHKSDSQKPMKTEVKKGESKKDEDKKNNSHKKEEKELKKEKDIKPESTKETKVDHNKEIKMEPKDNKTKSDKKKKKHSKSSKSVDIPDSELDEKKPDIEEISSKMSETDIKKEKNEESTKIENKYHSSTDVKPGKSDSAKSEMKVKTKAEVKDFVKNDLKVKSERKEDKSQKQDKNKPEAKSKSESKSFKQDKSKSKNDNKKSSKTSKEIETPFKDVNCCDENMDVHEMESVQSNLQNNLSDLEQPSKPKKAKLSSDLKAQGENLFSKFGPASEIYSSREDDSDTEEQQMAKKTKKKKTKKHKKGEKTSPVKAIEEIKEDVKKNELKNKEIESSDANHKKDKKKGKKKTKEKTDAKIDVKPTPNIKPKPKPVDPFDFDAFDRSESNDSMPTRLDVKSFPQVAEQIDKLDKHETMSESTTEEAIDSVGEKMNDTEDEKCPDSPKNEDEPSGPPKPPEKPEGLFDKFFEAVHMKKMKNIYLDKKPEPPQQSSKEQTKESSDDAPIADTTKESSRKEVSTVIKSPVKEDHVVTVTSPAVTTSGSPPAKQSLKVITSPTHVSTFSSMSPTKSGLSCLSPLKETVPSLISPLKSPVTITSPSRPYQGPISSSKPNISPLRSGSTIASPPGRSPHPDVVSPVKAAPTKCLSPLHSPQMEPVPSKETILSPKSSASQSSMSPVKIPALSPLKTTTLTKGNIGIPEIENHIKQSIPEVSSSQEIETPFMDEIDSDEREKAVQEASDEAARAVESLLQDSSDPDPFGFSTPEIESQRPFPEQPTHSQSSIEEIVFPDVNYQDSLTGQTNEDNKKQSPGSATKYVRNRRRSKGSKGSKDDSDNASEIPQQETKSNAASENDDTLEPEGELKIDFDNISNDTDNILQENEKYSGNVSLGLDDSFGSISDESRQTKCGKEGRGRGKGKTSRRGRGVGARKTSGDKLPNKDQSFEKEKPQFGSPIRTDPMSIFDTSLKEDSDSLVIDEDNHTPLFDPFHKEAETPLSDVEKSDSSSYKDQRPTRKRKQTNYKDIHAGIVPSTSQSPRTRATAASPRAGQSTPVQVTTSPRTRATASSPRAQRGSMTPKTGSSPRGQKSPKYSDIVSPVVKLELIDIAKSKKKEDVKKSIFGKEQNLKEETNILGFEEKPRMPTAFEDWKNSQSLMPEKPLVSKENVYEFEESEDFNANPCPSLRLRNKKKPITEQEHTPSVVKSEEPIAVSQPTPSLPAPKEPLHTVNMEIHQPLEASNNQAYGSDDSSASMSNVERIIHAVSKGIFGSAEKSDEEDDDEPKLHIAISGVSSPPVTTKSEVENMYNSSFISSGMDFLDKTPPRMDPGITSPTHDPPIKTEPKSEIAVSLPSHTVTKQELPTQQPWPLTSTQTIPFQPTLTTVDMMTSRSGAQVMSSTPALSTAAAQEKSYGIHPPGPAPALVPTSQATKPHIQQTPLLHSPQPQSQPQAHIQLQSQPQSQLPAHTQPQSIPSTQSVQQARSPPIQKSTSSTVATSVGTVSSRSMPSPLLLQHKTRNVPVQPILTPPPPQMSPNSSMQPQRPQSVQLPVQHNQQDNNVQRSPSVHSYPSHIQQQQQQQIQLQQFLHHHKMQQQHQLQQQHQQQQQQQQQHQQHQQQQQAHQQQQHQQHHQSQQLHQQKAHMQEPPSSREIKEPKRSEKNRASSQNPVGQPPYPFPAHSGHRQPTPAALMAFQNQMQRPVYPNDSLRHGIPIEHPRPGVTGELPRHGLPGESALHNVPGHHREPGERHRSIPTSRPDAAHQIPSHAERSRHPSGEQHKHIEQSRHMDLHHGLQPEASRHQNIMNRMEQRPAHTSSPMDVGRGMIQPNMVPTSAHQQRKTPSTPDSGRMKMTPPVTSNANTLYAGVVAGQPRSLSPKSASPHGQTIERIHNPGRQMEHHNVPQHVKHPQGNFQESHLARPGKEPESPRPLSMHGDVRGPPTREMILMAQSRALMQQQQEAAAAAALKTGQLPDPAHRLQASSPSAHSMMAREQQMIAQHTQQQSPLNLAESTREKPPSHSTSHAFNYPGNGKHLPNQIENRLPQSKSFLQPPGFPPGRGMPQNVPQLYGVEMTGFPPHGPFGVRLPVDPHGVYQGGVHREQFIPGRDIVQLLPSGFPQQILSPHPGYPLESHGVPTVVTRSEDSHGHRQEAPMVRSEMIRPGPREVAKGSGNVFQRYPIMWQGPLALKNDSSFVQMHFVAGNQELVKLTLPQLSASDPVPLRIAQRMRMEQTQLEGVSKRMQMESDYCLLLAVPCGRDHNDMALQTKGLTEGFIQYLQLKQAAGIVNIPMPGSQQPAYVVHIFPPCEFSHEAVARANPVLFENIRDMAHVVIIIVHCDASHA